MAAVVLGVTTASTVDGTVFTTASFTPVVDDWLVVTVQASTTAAAAPTLTASANGITFTRLTTNAVKGGAPDKQYVFVANQLVPSSPVAMTVTFTCTADAANGTIISAARVSGMTLTGTSGVRQSAKVDNVTAGTAPSVTLPAACLTSNPTLFCHHVSVQTGVTAPSGMTLRADGNHATPAAGGGFSSRNSGFTGTTITLGSTNNGACSGIALELDASAPSTAYMGWGIPV